MASDSPLPAILYMDTKESPSGSPPLRLWATPATPDWRWLHTFLPKHIKHHLLSLVLLLAGGGTLSEHPGCGACSPSYLGCWGGRIIWAQEFWAVVHYAWFCVCTKFGINMVTSWEWELPGCLRRWNGAGQNSQFTRSVGCIPPGAPLTASVRTWLKPSRQIQFLMKKQFYMAFLLMTHDYSLC